MRGEFYTFVSMIAFKNTKATSELVEILNLQAQNLSSALSDEVQKSQGFVTVQHDLPLLQDMAEKHGHAVAVDNHQVVGYALVMLSSFRDRIAILQPMFDRLAHLTYQGRSLPTYDYFVMGQVCIAEGYRGKGVFGGLYEQLKISMAPFFDVVITEVATRNQRSLRAHQKIGFKTLEAYTTDTGDGWNVLLWDLRDSIPDE